MNRNLLCFLWLLLFGLPRASAGVAADFEQANGRFVAGEYAIAAAAYERILESEGPRASVYYNLGNCFLKLRQFGPAILAYERARLLSPRDPDLLANLAIARKAAAAFEETGVHPALAAVIHFLSRNEWSWIVAGSALYLGLLSILCGAVRLQRRGMRQAALVSACVAGLLIAIGGAVLFLRRDEAHRGIVLTEHAAVHLSPFEKAESLGTPGPGRIVLMRGAKGGFHYVEVPGTNLRGWLPDKEVAAIAPRPAAK